MIISHHWCSNLKYLGYYQDKKTYPFLTDFLSQNAKALNNIGNPKNIAPVCG